MSTLPANVIRLADHRRPEPEPDWPPEPVAAGRHLRVVRPHAAVFRLEVFLARARAVMAEADAAAEGAEIIPLHVRQPA
jgi:hypothetical protein